MMETSPQRLVRDGLGALIPKFRRFALVLTGNPADADDLVQAALERALARADTYRPEYKLESWIFKIMQNYWIDEKRKQTRRGTHEDIETALNVIGEDGRKTVETQDMARRARIVIDALPDSDRVIVGLVLVNGESYQSAADILELPVGTVMSRLFRARKKIMEQLEPSDSTKLGTA